MGVVVFRDGWGEIEKRYDLTTLPLPADVAALLADAFVQLHATASEGTRRSCWHGLQSFARFIVDDGNVRSVHDLTTVMVSRFIEWFDVQQIKTSKQWSISTRANHLMAVRQLIDWTKRHQPSRLPARIDFPTRVYPVRTPESRPILSGDQLKVILRACYEEIDEAWEQFERGQTVIRSTGSVDGIDPVLARLIRRIAQIDSGTIPSQRELTAHRFSGPVQRYGGSRALAGYFHLISDTLAPFFIAIAIQLAANTEPLRRLERNCQVPHPLDENRIIVDWAKPRAGKRLKRAQRRSFDRRRRYATPNLIDKLLVMTAPLIEKARRQDRNLLFLLKSEKTGTAAVIPLRTLINNVKYFIDRANARIAIWNKAVPERPRAQLPNFVVALLRGSVATEHYKASGGDILEVQQLLNHARADTTEIYVKGPEAQRIQRETIAHLQSLMINWIRGENPAEAREAEQQTTVAGRAAAPFAHDCLDPFGGIASGAVAGRTCPHFGGCLRCPGLVIPIDAEHMARLLQAKRTLENAREHIDLRRWELLYAPSYRIIVDDILPDFPEALRSEAEARIPTLPQVPELE